MKVTADMVSKTTEAIDRKLNFFKLPEEAQTMISDRKRLSKPLIFPNIVMQL
jgi:hypothetical protein